VTLHLPSNVDNPRRLAEVFDALEVVQRKLPLVFPIHPRSRKMLAEHGLQGRVDAMSRLHLLDPVGYLDFLKLQKHAVLVLTDSGGIQEETTVLGVPCLTIRENTERPVTVQQGTNVLIGLNTERIVMEAERVLCGNGKRGTIPELWDGHTAERIVALLRRRTGLTVPAA
jgi:UDP-N-acetylglucosamine 2-epimerase (non-hydrolysing)